MKGFQISSNSKYLHETNKKVQVQIFFYFQTPIHASLHIDIFFLSFHLSPNHISCHPWKYPNELVKVPQLSNVTAEITNVDMLSIHNRFHSFSNSLSLISVFLSVWFFTSFYCFLSGAKDIIPVLKSWMLFTDKDRGPQI